jgi:L-ascorbate metabolism protein UlaG (beta-lactamase superfamily)
LRSVTGQRHTVLGTVDRAIRTLGEVLLVNETSCAIRSAATSVLRTALLGVTTAGMGLIAGAAWGLPTALGASRRAVEAVTTLSPRYRDGSFHNTQPPSAVEPVSATTMVHAILTRGDRGRPTGPVPLSVPEHPTVADQLAVTWYGHASVLIEVDGRRVLVDPVWSDRVSPSRLVGPKRMHPVPAEIEDLPPLDVVIISHDHYDHLDLETVRRLTAHSRAPFVVPLGVGAHLRAWGVPADRVVELDWGGQARVRELTLTCTEARHFSGRGLTRNNTLWASWVITGPQHGVFFGGDTGYTPVFAEIGARYGPFNLTLLPIGAYGDAWPDIHMNPEEAVRAHGDLGGGLLVPIHWGTFNLAFHEWDEPVRRLLAAAGRADTENGTRVAVPVPGERFTVLDPPSIQQRWWSALAPEAVERRS